MYRAGFYDHHRSGEYIAAAADSNGLAQGSIGPVTEGYCWYVERMTTWSNTAATTGLSCEIFVVREDQVATGFTLTVGDRAGRQDLSLAANNDVSDENSPIFVGPGYFLVAFWAGFTSGDRVLLSTQIAVHKLMLEVPAARVRVPTERELAHAVPQEPEQ